MAKLDLAVDELSDLAVSKLGEMLPPLDSFTLMASTDSRVKVTGGGANPVYQVEITDTLPTPADDPADYEALTSGTQTNIPVPSNNVVVMQKQTNLDQAKGIPFATKIPDAAKQFSHAIWDKCTAMMGAGGFGTIATATSAGIVQADAQNLRATVDAEDCRFFTQHDQSAALYPADRDNFSFTEQGAYGFSQIHKVSNFTGGVTDQVGFACVPQCAVAVWGDPVREADTTSLDMENSIIRRLPIPNLGITVEMRIWQNTATKDLYMTLELGFGIVAADDTAATTLTLAP